MDDSDEDKMLTCAAVAKEFGVNPKTVTRWAKAGKLKATRTLGGHRRYKASDIKRLIEENS